MKLRCLRYRYHKGRKVVSGKEFCLTYGLSHVMFRIKDVFW